MKIIQLAVLLGPVASVLASPDGFHLARDVVQSIDVATTTTLYSTSYFTVTKCAPDVTDCPADATTVHTSIVPVTSTMTICSVTSALVPGISSVPEQGGPSAPTSTGPMVSSSLPYLSIQTSTSSSNTGSQTAPYVPGVSSQTSPAVPPYFSTQTSGLFPSMTASVTAGPSTNIPGTYSTRSESTFVSSKPSLSASIPSTGGLNTDTVGTLISSGSSSGYGYQPSSTNSLFTSNSPATIPSTTHTEGIAISPPPSSSSSGYGYLSPSSSPAYPSNTFTEGVLISLEPSSSGYGYLSSGSPSSTYVTTINATYVFPSVSAPKSSSSVSLLWPTSGSDIGNATTSSQSPGYTVPDSITSTHVTSVVTHSITTVITVPPGYNGSATPTSSDFHNTITSVGTSASGTSASGGPSGSAGPGYPSPSGGNNTVTVPKPSMTIPANEGQPATGGGKSSIAAIVVALAFAHFA